MMKSRKKGYGCLPAAVVLSLLAAATAYAGSKDKVTSIRLEIEDNMQPGSALDEEEELCIESRTDACSVREWEILNEGTTWKRGDKPRVKVSIVTEDEHYFSVAKDNVSIKGDEAAVYYVKKEEEQLLTVVLDLKPMRERVGGIEDAWLKGTAAAWSPAIGAEGYELYLYRDSRAVGSRKTTTDTAYDFGTAMRKDGEYYYKVRAVGGEGVKEGRYTVSESLYISPDDAAGVKEKKDNKKAPLNNSQTLPGQWVQDEKGWRYNNPDGSRTVNNWAEIDGGRYYFGADSYMATGWIFWEDEWYYLGTEGELQSNCISPDGYIVDENGMRVW